MSAVTIRFVLCGDDECRCIHAEARVDGAAWTSEHWPYLDDPDDHRWPLLRAEVAAKAAELRAAGHAVDVEPWPLG